MITHYYISEIKTVSELPQVNQKLINLDQQIIIAPTYSPSIFQRLLINILPAYRRVSRESSQLFTFPPESLIPEARSSNIFSRGTTEERRPIRFGGPSKFTGQLLGKVSGGNNHRPHCSCFQCDRQRGLRRLKWRTPPP